MRTQLEDLATEAWKLATSYAKFAVCQRCGEFRYCRGKSPRRVTCVECFDARGGRL